MAERGKAEESQRTEAPGPGSRDKLQGILEQLQAVFGDSADVRFSVSVPAEGPSNVAVLIEAEPVLAKAQAGEVRVETTAAAPSDPESNVTVDRDDSYYDEVRRAVGRGAPTVLLGTSTKSLEANIRKIRAAQQTTSAGAPPSGPTGRIRRGRFHRAALLVLIVLLGLSTLLLILFWDRQPSVANAIQTSVLAFAVSFLVLTEIWTRYHKSDEKSRLTAALLDAEARRAKKQDKREDRQARRFIADRLKAESSSQTPDISEQTSKEKKG